MGQSPAELLLCSRQRVGMDELICHRASQVDFAWLGQEARKCLDLGLPLAVHAIGDRAVDEVRGRTE